MPGFANKHDFSKYPRQFWYLLIGSLIFTTGASLVWPFLSIYIQDKLDIPLRYSTLLISLRAFSGVFASFFFAGSFADRFGRRFLILISLLGGVIYYAGLNYSSAMWQFALLMVFWGMLDIFYPVGINAMVADILPAENRLEAYSILRIIYNLGYAIGPIFGGILAARSYSLIFRIAMVGYALSFVFMFFFTKETLTNENRINNSQDKDASTIVVVLKDRFFILSVFLMGMIYISSSGVFNLLSYYAGQNFGIPESSISYVFTVNAAMCVLMQLGVIQMVKNQRPLKLMCLAGFLYMIGVCGIALVDHVIWYCLCMAVMTLGELIMTPTMSDIAANLAPANARGRYMSVLSLSKPFGQGIGPALLGYINDMVSPRMMWVFGSVFAGISCIIFFVMDRKAGINERLQ